MEEQKWQQRLARARLRDCSSGSAGVGIIAGEKLSSDSRISRSAVFVRSETEDGKGADCTGTLVSSRIVLTAAHCFDSEKVKAKVVFSTDPICQIAKDETLEIQVRKIDRHPEYERMEQENENTLAFEKKVRHTTAAMAKYDVTLIELEDPAPEPYMPIPIGSTVNDNLRSSSYVAAGFGVTTGYGREDLQDPMLRFAALTQKTELSYTEQLYLYDSGVPYTELSLFYFSNQKDRSGVCSGDSGGPLFRYNGFSLEQVGVASFVFSTKRGEDPCANAGVHVKLAPLRPWLRGSFDRFFTGELNPF